jgi:hypothetical protein
MTPAELQKLKSAVEKFGTNIKSLKMEAKPSSLVFCEILSLIPNVESLFLLNMSSPQKERNFRDQEDLNLKHLKSLVMINCEEKFASIFKRLPTGVLRELVFSTGLQFCNNFLHEVLLKQQYITKLSSNLAFPLRFLENFKLKSLDLAFIIKEPMNEIIDAIKMQPGLESLRLKVTMCNETMAVISQLKHLNELKIEINESSITALNQLPKVKNLVFDGYAEAFIEAFALLDNSNLEYISISNRLMMYLRRTGQFHQFKASMPNILRFV